MGSHFSKIETQDKTQSVTHHSLEYCVYNSWALDRFPVDLSVQENEQQIAFRMRCQFASKSRQELFHKFHGAPFQKQQR